MREYEDAIRSTDDKAVRNLNFDKQEEERDALAANPVLAAFAEQEKRFAAAKKAMEEAATRDAPWLKEELEKAELPLDVEPLLAAGLIERTAGNKFKLLASSVYDLPLHARRHVVSEERTADANGKTLSTSVEFESCGNE